MVKVLYYGIVVGKFKLQLSSYVHLRTNTLGKGMNPLILPAMSQIVPLVFFWKDGYSIKQPKKVDMSLNNKQTQNKIFFAHLNQRG